MCVQESGWSANLTYSKLKLPENPIVPHPDPYHLSDLPVFPDAPLSSVGYDSTYYYSKRAFDILFCLLLFPLILPVMLIVAIAVKLDSKGNIFFGQTRTGRWGETFTCYKFRSMRIDAEEIKAQLMAQNEADGPVFKMKNDPRVTRVGRVIRKLSLDELPQLWNIFMGEMSFVGPRPAVPYEVEQYDLHQLGRLDAMPGLTGLQQVSGRSNIDFERWVELDMHYIDNQSMLFDLAILVRTVPTVVLSKGAY